MWRLIIPLSWERLVEDCRRPANNVSLLGKQKALPVLIRDLFSVSKLTSSIEIENAQVKVLQFLETK
jgi:hypothetical protein